MKKLNKAIRIIKRFGGVIEDVDCYDNLVFTINTNKYDHLAKVVQRRTKIKIAFDCGIHNTYGERCYCTLLVD